MAHEPHTEEGQVLFAGFVVAADSYFNYLRDNGYPGLRHFWMQQLGEFFSE